MRVWDINLEARGKRKKEFEALDTRSRLGFWDNDNLFDEMGSMVVRSFRFFFNSSCVHEGLIPIVYTPHTY